MKKIWLVFRNEYFRHVRKKGFIFGIVSMPLFVVLMVAIGFVSVWLEYNDAPVGYVDPDQILTGAEQLPVKEKKIFPPVAALPFETEEAASAALQNESIQGYFLLSENYINSGEVTFFKAANTGSNAESDFGDFIVYNLLRSKPQQIANRLAEGSNLIIRSLDGSRELEADNWTTILVPMFAGILFIIAVNVSGNYLLQAVVEEKENRTMEILLTSISPGELMAGKVIGNLMVGLTQLAAWIVFAIIALKFIPTFMPIGGIPRIETANLWLIVATFLPAFVMVAAAMGAVGATATEAREAQQITGWFTIPIVIPLWFINAIMFNPNGPLSVAMSLIPFTAPIALPMRAVFTSVPAWQIIFSITTLCLLAVFALWLSGRIFRLGMLRYGKRVRLREVFERKAGRA